MKKISIFHFSAIELFPPVINLIEFLGEALPGDIRLEVYTSTPPSGNRIYKSKFAQVKINRIGNYKVQQPKYKLYWLYIIYNISSIVGNLYQKPWKMMYFESFSVLPVCVLNKIFPRIPIFIHYHEYMSPAEISENNYIRIMHRLEQQLYRNDIKWISHTNMRRLELFLSDNGLKFDCRFKLMPNYPSRKWSSKSQRRNLKNIPGKLLYVGALDTKSFYIEEIVTWVEKQQGKVSLDIFSHQENVEVKLLVGRAKNVHFRGFVEYADLPDVMSAYDAGLILYKGLSANFMYNAPNKLFEYLACGLDVWFPENLAGILSYVRTEVPRVIPVNFEDPAPSLEMYYSNVSELVFSQSEYYCEQVYSGLAKELFNT